jgi:hypothetical protein
MSVGILRHGDDKEPMKEFTALGTWRAKGTERRGLKNAAANLPEVSRDVGQ